MVLDDGAFSIRVGSHGARNRRRVDVSRECAARLVWTVPVPQCGFRIAVGALRRLWAVLTCTAAVACPKVECGTVVVSAVVDALLARVRSCQGREQLPRFKELRFFARLFS